MLQLAFQKNVGHSHDLIILHISDIDYWQIYSDHYNFNMHLNTELLYHN